MNRLNIFELFLLIIRNLLEYAWHHRSRELSYCASLNYFPEHHAIMSMIINYGTDGKSPLKPVFIEMRDKVAEMIVEANKKSYGTKLDMKENYLYL